MYTVASILIVQQKNGLHVFSLAEYELVKSPSDEELQITEYEPVEVTTHVALAATDQDWHDEDTIQLRLDSFCGEHPSITMGQVSLCPLEIRNRTCIRCIIQILGDIELNNRHIGLCVMNGNSSQSIKWFEYMYWIRVVPQSEGTDPSLETTDGPASNVAQATATGSKYSYFAGTAFKQYRWESARNFLFPKTVHHVVSQGGHTYASLCHY